VSNVATTNKQNMDGNENLKFEGRRQSYERKENKVIEI
jgi:hypothetical protein